MRQRISRGTPLALTTAEIEATLASLTPATELAICNIRGLTLEEWQALPDRLKVKHILDHQNVGFLAASLNAATRAQTDLEEAGVAATRVAQVDALADEVVTLREMVKELTQELAAARKPVRGAKGGSK